MIPEAGQQLPRQRTFPLPEARGWQAIEPLIVNVARLAKPRRREIRVALVQPESDFPVVLPGNRKAIEAAIRGGFHDQPRTPVIAVLPLKFSEEDVKGAHG
jgi:hypothetical protein